LESRQSNIELSEKSVKLYSLNKAASLLGIGWNTLMTLIDNGEIGTVKVLNRQKISFSELHRFITSDQKPIPIVPSTSAIPQDEKPNRRKIERASIDQIFNRIKKEVIQNEKAKKTYLLK
jgi:excisionase family DNA binding protein